MIQTHIIANLLRAAFTESIWTFVPGTYIPEDFRQIELLDKHVLSIFAELDSNSTSPFDDTGSDDGTTPNTLVFKECHLKVHVYVNHEGTYQLLGLPSDEDEDGEAAEAGDTQTPAASVLQLPDVMLDGLWQNLIFEQDVKENLLSVGPACRRISQRPMQRRSTVHSNDNALLGCHGRS